MGQRFGTSKWFPTHAQKEGPKNVFDVFRPFDDSSQLPSSDTIHNQTHIGAVVLGTDHDGVLN